MTSYVAAEKIINVGREVVIEASSHQTAFSVVFEDDGNTGYFYALDTSQKSDPIQDALHIYDVASVSDKEKPAKVQVLFSADGEKSLLLINNYPHAAFNFSAKQGYCRSAFPEPIGNWSASGHNWSETILEYFR